MEVEFGAAVADKNGRNLGTVAYIVRDTWSGEIKKFLVRQQDSGNSLFLSPDVVAQATAQEVTLGASLEELSER